MDSQVLATTPTCRCRGGHACGPRRSGCLLYEVGVDDEQPDTVYVAELWTSAAAHRSSLELASVQPAIQARPLRSGQMGVLRFEVVGSPRCD